MTDTNSKSEASNGPLNFFNKLRMKVALLATPKAITPEQFFALAGISPADITKEIVDRYYENLVKDYARQFANAVVVDRYATIKPDILEMIISANTILDDSQKAKINAILQSTQLTSRDSSYVN